MTLTAIPSLVTLVLENTAVTDIGVRQYASHVPPMLENLDLSRTNVTQNIFEPLRGIVTEHSALITLTQPFNRLSLLLHERADHS